MSFSDADQVETTQAEVEKQKQIQILDAEGSSFVVAEAGTAYCALLPIEPSNVFRFFLEERSMTVAIADKDCGLSIQFLNGGRVAVPCDVGKEWPECK